MTDPEYYIYWTRTKKQLRRSNGSLKPIRRQRRKALVRHGMGKKQCNVCTIYNLARNKKCNFCGNKF
jgi:hypothetical protein